MSTANPNFDNAMRLHKKGDLAAAEPLYRAVLQDDSNHVDANCMLGALLTQDGRVEESLRLLRKVVSLQPDHFVAHHRLGHALKAQGDVPAAIEQYRKAVRINPNFVEGLNSLGCALRDTHQYDEAAAAFTKLTNVDPTFACGHLNLGLVHLDRNELDLAIRRFHDAIDWDTDCFDAYHHLGHAYRDKIDYDQAIAYYNKALQMHPSDARVITDIGVIFQRKRDFAEAQRWYERALGINPELPEALCNMGTLCQERGAYDEAMKYYEHALGIHPDYVECLIAISDTYQKLGREQEALASAEYAMYLAPQRFRVRLNFGKALLWNHRFEESEHQLEWCLSKKPDHTDALIYMGLLNTERGRPQPALQWFNRVIDRHPQDAVAHVHRGAVLLALGRLEQGWQEWDWLHVRNERTGAPRDSVPVWKGESLTDKSILVRVDSVLPDAILFMSCLPDLLRGAGRCFVHCDQRLEALFKRSFPAATVLGDASPLPAKPATDTGMMIDYQIAAVNLPRYLRSSIDVFPRQNVYLQADQERVLYWRCKLHELGAGPKIGLAWRSKKMGAGRGTHYVGIDDFGELLKGQPAVFISLAEGDGSTDVATLAQRHDVTIHRFEEVVCEDKVDDLFALVAALDLVIATNVSAIHVAGSLGKPAWLLSLPRREWINLGSDSVPWYPSVERICKIGRDEWNIPIVELADRLHALVPTAQPLLQPSAITALPVESAESITPDLLQGEDQSVEVTQNRAQAVAVGNATTETRVPAISALYTLALARYQSGDLAGAEEFCHQGLEEHPHDANLYCLLGSVFAETERGAAALALLEKARNLDSGNALISIQLARVYGLLGLTRQQVECLVTACQANPEDGQAHLQLALALEKEGNLEGAAVAAQLASFILLESREAREVLARVTLNAESTERALDALMSLHETVELTPQLLSWDGTKRMALAHQETELEADSAD